MKLYYITGNQDKVNDAKRKLNDFPHIELIGLKIEGTIEPQSENIEDISLSKAKQAYEHIKKPLIVNDSGWSIPSLNGFPGAYMSYVNKCFTPKDFLNIMKDKKDKSIILKEVVTYIDSYGIKQFTHEFVGKFTTKPRGKGRPSDTLIMLGNSNKTIAENQELQLSSVNSSGLWQELAEWITTKNNETE